MTCPSPVALNRIESAILSLRGQRILLDADLAALYGVETKALNRAVKRNRSRFPADFMFRLMKAETSTLRYQIGTSNDRGGRRYLPYAFTEQCVAILSIVLHGSRAVRVNIGIMRAFVRLRQMLQSNAELARKLTLRERRCDARFKAVFEAIRELMAPPLKPHRAIRFQPIGSHFRPSPSPRGPPHRLHQAIRLRPSRPS
jgi:hypothetical protein